MSASDNNQPEPSENSSDDDVAVNSRISYFFRFFLTLFS